MSDTRFSVDDLVQIRVGRGRIVLASPPAVAPSQSKNERNDEHAEHDAQNTDQPLETGESTRRRSLAPPFESEERGGEDSGPQVASWPLV